MAHDTEQTAQEGPYTLFVLVDGEWTAKESPPADNLPALQELCAGTPEPAHIMGW